MKVLSTSLFACLVVLLCGGCMLKFEDVSKEPEYMPLLNTRYSLSTSMLVQGINMDLGYGENIHHYSIKPFNMRGSGPEHITNITFHAGHKIEVLGIQRSTIPVLFVGKITRAILSSDFELKPQAPLVVDLEYLQSTNYMRRLKSKGSSKGSDP